MFLARGITLSLSVFVLLYGSLSFLVTRGWSAVQRSSQRFSARATADLLLALRVMPLGISALVTVGFMVPSFLLLEPHSIDEPIGVIPLVLGCCGAILFVIGVIRTVEAQVRTFLLVQGWLADSTPVCAGAAVPVFRIRGVLPALTAAGIRKPRVLMSAAAAAALTGPELRTALRHEVAHVRRRDNLKKLLFRFCAFPGMADLEEAWSQAAEIAADDIAVSSSDEALDLASALIKLSRFALVPSPAAITTALMSANAASMNARVERLVAWHEGTPAVCRFSLWYVLAAVLGTVVCLTMTYGTALAQVHAVTEWLVR
jgi:Zn-dependent protease with chaperone function